MKFSRASLLTTAAGLAGFSSAVDTDVASVKMAALMELKTAHRENQRGLGAFASGAYVSQGPTPCVAGKAGQFSCENVDLKTFLTHADMGSATREGNDVWGWTSADGREFAAVGQTDGTAFVEVLKDGTLAYVGRLPTQTSNSIWRDMKVIGDHLYVGAEAGGHGLQIFDMKKLLSLSASSPKTFSVTTDLTAWYRGFGSSHNIVANPDTNFIYAVGTAMRDGCRGGLWMVNVTDPARPTSPGCVSSDGYVHDAQCVVYTGPDTRYSGHEICFNFNEDTLTIVDVTSKSNPVQLSRTSYDTAQYTHQGWLATPDMRFLLIDDELDEEAAAPGSAAQRTTTYIVDISKLTAPKFTGIYRSPSKSVDHNQYVSRGLAFQSNYGSGLRIVDVSSVAADPSGSRFKQTGFFDCYPEDDAENGVVDFNGSWSVYPYFASGYIILNSIERGVFSLKYTGTWPLTESA